MTELEVYGITQNDIQNLDEEQREKFKAYIQQLQQEPDNIKKLALMALMLIRPPGTRTQPVDRSRRMQVYTAFLQANRQNPHRQHEQKQAGEQRRRQEREHQQAQPSAPPLSQRDSRPPPRNPDSTTQYEQIPGPSAQHMTKLEECCVCLNEFPVSQLWAIVPCGHRCVCENCARNLKERNVITCPICRSPFEKAIRIFDHVDHVV